MTEETTTQTELEAAEAAHADARANHDRARRDAVQKRSAAHQAASARQQLLDRAASGEPVQDHELRAADEEARDLIYRAELAEAIAQGASKALQGTVIPLKTAQAGVLRTSFDLAIQKRLLSAAAIDRMVAVVKEEIVKHNALSEEIRSSHAECCYHDSSLQQEAGQVLDDVHRSVWPLCRVPNVGYPRYSLVLMTEAGAARLLAHDTGPDRAQVASGVEWHDQGAFGVKR